MENTLLIYTIKRDQDGNIIRSEVTPVDKYDDHYYAVFSNDGEYSDETIIFPYTGDMTEPNEHLKKIINLHETDRQEELLAAFGECDFINKVSEKRFKTVQEKHE